MGLHEEATNQGEAEPSLQPAAKACMLCGDEAGVSEGLAGDQVPCACSRGHAVCATCLRQYVLHTHGLQVRRMSPREPDVRRTHELVLT